jgi:hypothetical protein
VARDSSCRAEIYLGLLGKKLRFQRAGDQSPASTINRAPHLFSAKNQQLSLPQRKTRAVKVRLREIQRR